MGTRIVDAERRYSFHSGRLPETAVEQSCSRTSTKLLMKAHISSGSDGCVRDLAVLGLGDGACGSSGSSATWREPLKKHFILRTNVP